MRFQRFLAFRLALASALRRIVGGVISTSSALTILPGARRGSRRPTVEQLRLLRTLARSTQTPVIVPASQAQADASREISRLRGGEPATGRQLATLSVLARRSGSTLIFPRTRADADREIVRLGTRRKEVTRAMT